MEKLYASTTSSVATSGSAGAGAGASTSVKLLNKLLILPTQRSGAPAIASAGPRQRRLRSCGARLVRQSSEIGAPALAQASGTKVGASVRDPPTHAAVTIIFCGCARSVSRTVSTHSSAGQRKEPA